VSLDREKERAPLARKSTALKGLLVLLSELSSLEIFSLFLFSTVCGINYFEKVLSLKFFRSLAVLEPGT
jgi:hypothetical protein